MILFGISAALSNAADTIGFVYAAGISRIAGASVRGSATVFDGDTIEAGDGRTTVQLKNGARIWLMPGTSVKVSSEAAVLLRGAGQLQAPPPYTLEARAVRIVPSRPETLVRVAVDDQGGALVIPLAGAVDITNTHGTHVGALVPGAAVRFVEQVSDAGVKLSGCLSGSHGQFTITDAVTNLKVQVTGTGLEGEAGHIVGITGREQTAVPGTMPIVSVSRVDRISSANCSGPLMLASGAASESPGQLTQTRPVMLNLLVVEGEGAVNNIRQRTARDPIVEVQDENHRPVSGALVLFALPRSGPGGTFANGARTLSVTTDAQGRAVGRGLRPNNIAGQFEIAVTASLAGITAAIRIRQTNALIAPGTPGPTQAPEAAGTPPGKGTSGTTPGQRGTTSAGGAAGTGLSAGTKIAIIGGIAATATVSGLAAGGVFSGGTDPPASR